MEDEIAAAEDLRRAARSVPAGETGERAPEQTVETDEGAQGRLDRRDVFGSREEPDLLRLEREIAAPAELRHHPRADRLDGGALADRSREERAEPAEDAEQDQAAEGGKIGVHRRLAFPFSKLAAGAELDAAPDPRFVQQVSGAPRPILVRHGTPPSARIVQDLRLEMETPAGRKMAQRASCACRVRALTG
jgi:hypothetical protein